MCHLPTTHKGIIPTPEILKCISIKIKHFQYQVMHLENAVFVSSWFLFCFVCFEYHFFLQARGENINLICNFKKSCDVRVVRSSDKAHYIYDIVRYFVSLYPFSWTLQWRQVKLLKYLPFTSSGNIKLISFSCIESTC